MGKKTRCFWCHSKTIATLSEGRVIYDCGNEITDRRRPYGASNRTPLCHKRQGKLLAKPVKTAMDALRRLASGEAFMEPRALDPNADRELMARWNYATAALAKLEGDNNAN